MKTALRRKSGELEQRGQRELVIVKGKVGIRGGGSG